jgi:hypothetical protein
MSGAGLSSVAAMMSVMMADRPNGIQFEARHGCYHVEPGLALNAYGLEC